MDTLHMAAIYLGLFAILSALDALKEAGEGRRWWAINSLMIAGWAVYFAHAVWVAA
jgi:hypothetical protein